MHFSHSNILSFQMFKLRRNEKPRAVQFKLDKILSATLKIYRPKQTAPILNELENMRNKKMKIQNTKNRTTNFQLNILVYFVCSDARACLYSLWKKISNKILWHFLRVDTYVCERGKEHAQSKRKTNIRFETRNRNKNKKTQIAATATSSLRMSGQCVSIIWTQITRFLS